LNEVADDFYLTFQRRKISIEVDRPGIVDDVRDREQLQKLVNKKTNCQFGTCDDTHVLILHSI